MSTVKKLQANIVVAWDFKNSAQLPATALGYKPVFDYKIDQLGRQGSHEGMILVDGTYYCPSMPDPLITATKDFRDGTIDEATHQARITERKRFAIRARSHPDPDGHVRVQCPASGPHPTVCCVLKPKSEGGDGKVKTRIPVTDVLAAHPPKICSQATVTMPPEAGAKFRQALAHETAEWKRTYATLRSSNEGMNGFIKDGAREAADNPQRRRIRGMAPQSVLLAFQLFAANIRKITQFLAKREAETKKVRKLPTRRKTTSLKQYAPAPILVSAAAALDASADPDPPLTA